jgi:modulator of FtsH protease
MNITQAIIREWQTFYLLAGTAAATLIGLLFIAISIQLDVFHQKTSANLQFFAALTFNCFFYVLLISMMFIIPGLSPLGLGMPLLAFGILALLGTLIQRQRARTEPKITARFTLPILGLIILVVCAILLMMEIAQSLYGFVIVVLLFLSSASRNAWDLLISARVKK